MSEKNQTNRSAFIVVTTLFFMWGFITVLVDALIPRLREVFELSYFEAGLVQFSFFTAYFVMSIPSGGLISRIGYKKGVITGLITMGAGCLLFYPAASLRVFPIFLIALFVLASGITMLQVAANPYVAALGPAKTASSRLNLSQAFNSLGTTIAPLVSAAFILGNTVASSTEVSAMTEIEREAYYIAEAGAVQGPFLVLSMVLLVLAGVFAAFKLPKILESDHDRSGSYRSALKYKHLIFGAIGIFVYVGAEVTIGSYLVNYFLSLDVESLVEGSSLMTAVAGFLSGSEPGQLNPARLAGTFVFFYWGGAMIGRFIGSAIQLKVQPAKLLSMYAGANVLLLIFTMLSSDYTAFFTVLSMGLFNSIMFPTIFTLSIDGIGNNTAQGSGILCTAIVGGAFIPPLYGYFADLYTLQAAFIIPLVCYLYITWYGLYGAKIDDTES
ncbi:sugar MFS transporter [Balneola sp. MJW-20]|uniref:sugar MFS transporter n=1 Tax=Gracilimonas aurantiaca TaxID=3234185 RepID=UPI0034653B47